MERGGHGWRIVAAHPPRTSIAVGFQRRFDAAKGKSEKDVSVAPTPPLDLPARD